MEFNCRDQTHTGGKEMLVQPLPRTQLGLQEQSPWLVGCGASVGGIFHCSLQYLKGAYGREGNQLFERVITAG